MHSQKAMWDICTAYCLAIKTLINHASDENRATLALEAVRAYATNSEQSVSPLVTDWLQEAQQLCDTVEDKTFFGIRKYNVQD